MKLYSRGGPWLVSICIYIYYIYIHYIITVYITEKILPTLDVTVIMLYSRNSYNVPIKESVCMKMRCGIQFAGFNTKAKWGMAQN